MFLVKNLDKKTITITTRFALAVTWTCVVASEKISLTSGAAISIINTGDDTLAINIQAAGHTLFTEASVAERQLFARFSD